MARKGNKDVNAAAASTLSTTNRSGSAETPVGDGGLDAGAGDETAPFDAGAGARASGAEVEDTELDVETDVELDAAAEVDAHDADEHERSERARAERAGQIRTRLNQIGQPVKVLDDIKMRRAEVHSRRQRVIEELEAEAQEITREYERQEREIFQPLVAERYALEAELRRLEG
ncbi:MAG: hypothetical protein ACK5MB_00070 [Phycisphaerales bacterium]|jgi:hypothetical protein